MRLVSLSQASAVFTSFSDQAEATPELDNPTSRFALPNSSIDHDEGGNDYDY
jgi:hypothetical protein